MKIAFQFAVESSIGVKQVERADSSIMSVTKASVMQCSIIGWVQ